ncbi:MAG: helix-turn-helix transcriptional regulator [Clostridium perfringens]|uniref:helix-turn-helix transcriptional regulator n=1 Tax=Clostridium perfringens TaxID=1502 RepID=UPI002915B87D|nr:helix-turn-helix transcriptional regulator [Clostridium perfringens]MDU3535708.1 helix-turn-helix transcriptional regulator [Clostridium perfringens]
MLLLETKLILKMLRTKYNITQEELAIKLGISKNTYFRKENGLKDFTITEAIKIGEIFNVNPSEIFFTNKVTNCITKLV